MSIEQSGQTEEMRHVPKVEVLLRRIDPTLRTTGSILIDAISSEQGDRTEPALRHLERAIRWLESVDAILRPRQHVDAKDADVARRFAAAADHAFQALSQCDRSQFRRRTPCHLFERSKGESVTAAMAAAEHQIDRAAEALSEFVPDIHHRLWAALNPADEFPQIAAEGSVETSREVGAYEVSELGER